MGTIRTKRWDDPIDAAGDGTRILVTRYRPRGLAKADETWGEWLPAVAPSRALHAAAYGEDGLQIGWESYRTTYLREMRSQHATITSLAGRVRAGETITLLCSSQCVRESRCHRSLLKALIERELSKKMRSDTGRATLETRSSMMSVTKTFASLVLAITLIVAHATCLCAPAASRAAMHACCAAALRAAGHDGRGQPAGCGHCVSADVATVDPGQSSAEPPAPVSFADATAYRIAFVTLTSHSPPAPTLAKPPPDVLARRNVLQI